MTHIEITDVTGVRWVGDPGERALTDAEREELHELLRNFNDLNHISLEVGGSKHYFNPAHIVAVSIHEGA